MNELQRHIYEQATQGGEPQHRRSFVCGDVVAAMGFAWDGEPLSKAQARAATPTLPPQLPDPPALVNVPPAPVAPVAEAPAPAPAPVVEAPPVVVAEAPAPAPVVEPETPAAEEPDPTPDDPNPKSDDAPVEALGLTAGVVAALKAAGVNTAGEARAQDAAGTLEGLPGIGPAKLNAIRAALK